MPKPPPITTDQIRKAARELGQLRPAYKAMLSFYEDVFIHQEKAKGEIDLEPIRLSPEALQDRTQNHRPLVKAADFVFDPSASDRLLGQLGALTVSHGTQMQASAEALSRAVAGGDLDPQLLFGHLLQGDEVFLERAAAQIGADPRALAFLAFNSLQPSLELCGDQLASYLDAEAVWRKGFCPICGSAAGLGVLAEEGRRLVSCSFCRHQWQAPRIFCVFCENTATDELHYVFTEEEGELRADVCDHCRRYLKTVDRRQISRPIFPPLEQVASLHLDMIATERGYRSGVDVHLEP